MELQRSDYPSILNNVAPTPAAAILRDRIRKSQALNAEIADWIQERRRVEEAYVLGLQKLAKKSVPSDPSSLGTFQEVWHQILNSTTSLASSHSTLNRKLQHEVEQPLRDFFTANREWSQVKNTEVNLAQLAKSIDSAEAQAEKQKKKGGKAVASRVAEATDGVTAANSNWESQAPFIFEQFQAADESRITHLRETLTKFQTAMIDQAQTVMELADRNIVALVSLETSEEIKAFTAKCIGSRAPLQRQRTGPQPGPPEQRPSVSGSVAGSVESPPTISTERDDRASLQSAGSGSLQPPKESSGGLHGLGLKRLGTVLRGRSNRNSTILSPYQRPHSPAKKSAEALGLGRTPSASTSMSTPPRTTSSNYLSPRIPGSPRKENQTLASPASPARGEPAINGESSTMGTSREPPPSPLIRTPSVTITEEPKKDAEGYTVPPSETERALPSIPMGAMGAELNPEPSFKVEIKNNAIPEEDPDDANAAVSRVTNTLRATPTVSRRSGRGRRDVRNTMFVPDNEAIPQEPTATSPPLTPLKLARVPGVTGITDGAASDTRSDTQSVRSSRSVTSLANTIIKHPDITDPGLTASIIESVSVILDHGTISKTHVVGEIALAHQPALPSDDSSPTEISPTKETVRLDHFEVLEKVAPNPVFVSQLPEKDGEYEVDLAGILKTSVAFKYQVHIDTSTTNSSTFAPILITPSWKLEAHQASLIINYSPNPSFKGFSANEEDSAATSNGGGTLPVSKASIVLKNVAVLAGVDGVATSTCQLKPPGNFSRERGRVMWKLGDLTLDSQGGGGGVLLARFSTSGTAIPAPVEARWEVTSDPGTTVGSGLALSRLVEAEKKPVAPAPLEKNPFDDEETTPTNPPADLAVGELSNETSWKEVRAIRKIISGKYVAR